MSADAVLFARLQFGITAVSHWLFVALTLGLVTFVVLTQTIWTVTRNPMYERMTKFWGQLYVINYALGIATGIVMEFQFGLNWSGLTKVIGSTIGSPLAVETLVAFFLESTFLGMWIFGWRLLNRWVHLALIWLTAVTAWASVFWVLMANSFLQHPVGHLVTEDGKAVLADFWVFASNPNFWAALPHVMAAAITTGLVFVAGVSAYHLRRLPEGHRDHKMYLRSLQISVYVMPVFVFITAFMGGSLLDEINIEQPIKGALADDDLALAGKYAQEMADRHGGSSAEEYIPPHVFIYATRTIMIWSAITMQAIAVITALMTIRNAIVRHRSCRWMLRVLPWLIPVPFVAGASGWLFREVGRQPWVVYETLKTEDAVSPGLSSGALFASLVVFASVVAVLAVTDWWLLARYARRGPDGAHLGRAPDDGADDPELAPAGADAAELPALTGGSGR